MLLATAALIRVMKSSLLSGFFKICACVIPGNMVTNSSPIPRAVQDIIVVSGLMILSYGTVEVHLAVHFLHK